MRNILFALIALLTIFSGYTQSIHDYKYVVVPTRFEFQSKENQYRVSTVLKSMFTDIGFMAVYNTDIMPATVAADRCKALFADLVRDNSLFSTKLAIILRDCSNREVFKSEVGSSKEKNFERAYHEALKMAFNSVRALNYSYQGESIHLEESAATSTVAQSNGNAEISSATDYVVEAISTGFIVIDAATSIVKYRLTKTSVPNVYTAVSGDKTGVVFKESGDWIFEYMQGAVLTKIKTGFKLP